MFGPDFFAAAGSAGDWDRWDAIKDIRIPTLVIGGGFDQASTEDFQKMGRLIPKSRAVICEKGSHWAMYDDQETYFRELIRFIRDVEADRFK